MISSVLDLSPSASTPTLQTPIMIYGQMPRCGTNYLIDLLSHHQNVHREPAGILEFHHFMEIEGLHHYLDRMSQTNHMKSLDQSRLKQHLGQAWLQYFADHMPNPEQQMVLKESNIDSLEHFFDYFPQARLILVVRDGRNAVASALKSKFVAPPSLAQRMTTPGRWIDRLGTYSFKTLGQKIWQRLTQSDFEIICDRWNQSALKVQSLLQQFAIDYADQVLLVRYEDLHQQTAAEMAKILDFCGLSDASFDWQGMGQMPVRGSSFLRDAAGKIDFQSGIKADDSFTPMERWKNLSVRQQSTFWRTCKSGMEVLEYDTSGAD